MTQETYWYGEPCEAEKVTITVADMPEFPGYWVREQGLVGTERPACGLNTADQPSTSMTTWAGGGARSEEMGNPLAAHAELHPVEGSVRPREA